METKKILIVEDEGVAALEMQEFIELNGFTVVGPVDSADKVIETVLRTDVDLILMDIKLKSYIDGIDAAQRISIMKHIPVIFLTAYPDSMIRERAMKTQPAAYLEKPVPKDELLKIIQETLK